MNYNMQKAVLAHRFFIYYDRNKLFFIGRFQYWLMMISLMY
ncbi:hypothetical protein V7654_10915 [Bacillus sp. JJ1609]